MSTRICLRCLADLFTVPLGFSLFCWLWATTSKADTHPQGTPITYQLLTEGPLPRTYRVTLAITDPKNPDWIVSQFVAGAVRTVTAENQGKFTEYWNGLDDNFMPVPPGRYGVKGIYMPAERWHINGEYHTLIPKLAVAAGDPWFPDRRHEDKLPYLYGASVGYMAAIGVAPNGRAAFLHNYLENSLNDFLVDLNKPIGYDQVIRAHPSFGTAGGWATATDGEVIWSACTNGGIPFVYRADRKPFGNGRSGYVNNVWLPSGDINALAAWRDPASGKRFLYVAEDETFSILPWPDWKKGPQKIKKEGVGNRIVLLDGDTAKELAHVAVRQPTGLVVRGGKKLYALHRDDAGQFVVSDLTLKDGLPNGQWHRRFALSDLTAPPRGTWPDRTRIWTPLPPGFAVDSRENFYVSDPMHNQVYRLDNQGRIIHRFGRAARQKPGHYDEHIFMTPTQLAVWTDARGQDRLLILERGGPGRISEWTPDGRLLRQWFAGPWSGDQGYAVDPEDPEHVYGVCASEAIPSFGLVRFRVNYNTGEWKVDAVWPDICSCIDPVNGGTFPGGCDHWKVINYKGRKYLAFARSTHNTYGFMVYRQDGDNWVPSAALIPVPRKDMPGRPLFWGAGFVEGYWWHDANGDGKLQEEEYRNNPTKLPGPIRYFGENWLDDLSLTWIQEGSPHIWRIAPVGFDKHGNPIFDGRGWQKLLTDPVYLARAEGKANALYGGNELADRFGHHWEFVDGSPAEGFYVCARGGKDFDANSAPQYKISRYVPDGKGGYVLKWRTGRAVYGRQLGALAEPGEMYSSLIITRPVNGLLGVQDSWGGLYHIYTDDGLYVDTLFSDSFRYPLPKGGVYFLGGENFSGYHFLNKKNGKVYVCMTANNPCCLFEVQGWTQKQNPVRRLTSLPASVTLEPQHIANPPEHALQIRGGAGRAWLARFYPATGGAPALDGSLSGWESCNPVFFRAGNQQTVEVCCFYDPEHIFLRWHARLGRKFEPKLLHLADRIFTHDRGADTLSFYLQGDPNAKPGVDRPGDVRLVFGIFEENGQLQPVCLGMYPKWSGPGKANPVTYGSAVAPAAFAHVALLQEVKLGYQLDADGQGMVLAAAVPRKLLPQLPAMHGGLRSRVNFEATLGGRNKFWWANLDGSASVITLDEPAEARLYQGSWAPAQWVDVHNQAIRVWNVIGPFGFEQLPKLRHLEDRPTIWETLLRTKFPPETNRDVKTRYQGPMTQTRQKQRTLTWQSYNTGAGDILDFQQALDWKRYPDEGTAYAMTYIHSPAGAKIQLRFLHTGGAHALRVWLNDKLLPPVVQGQTFSPKWFPVPPAQEKPISGRNVQATGPQTIRLQAGWNQLLLRFDWIWGPQQVGVVIDGDEKTLWQLRLRAQPPDHTLK